MPAPGQVLGKYTIERAVARGRSGAVYRATTPLGDPVAIKVHDRPEAAATEIECLESTDHPSLIELVESGRSPGEGAWLALPWVEGQTLAHLLDTQAPLELDRTRRITSEVADALDALHDAGFVHGDLAPSNILVGDNDQVTVIDLATATRLGDSRPSPDTTVGIELETTPRFASPEVARGETPGPASDIYALALITYQALTGASPFAEVATPIAMLSHHASSAPAPVTEHRPDLPGAVEDALAMAMAKQPSDRPSSASEFARLIGRDGPGRVVDAVDGVDTAERADEPRPRSRRPSSRAARLAMLAVVGLGMAGVVALLLSINESSPQPLLQGRKASEVAAELSRRSGDAAGTVCNLAVGSGFEGSAVPDHFFIGDETNTTALAPGAGVDATSALRIGANGAFGLFGEIVPVDPDEVFVLSAWLRLQGQPDVAAMYVDYLDAEFAELTMERAAAIEGPLMGTAEGDRLLIVSEPPPGAAFAVPTFFKDASGGSLLVDEVVFGPQSECLAGLDS